ncbi:EI24 domain-containing protein [Nocardioides sp.]|uniref:EI24 domain-containing protein n=1 Tax=Nocardioides sp. TaxID=35761 RepID=UPI00271EA187|nr:EI24 domain-containing protein [Nocardioides sp.]MDO9456717.1 EI24 domain-containing protein [Nocardioides sp.]
MRDYRAGAACLGRGWRLLKQRPRLLLLGMLPAFIVWVVLATAFVLLILNIGGVTAWMTPFADDWADVARQLVRFFLGLALVVGSVLLWSATFTGLTLTIGDPFYERIWRATEDMIGPVKLGEGLGFWHSALDGLKLAAVGVLTSVLVLVSGFLPVVGPVLGIVLGLLLSGRLLGRELVSRPLEARGMDRHAQRALLEPHRRRVMGLGVATQACFFVPFGGVLVMPVAVAAATVLARDVLPDERGPAYVGELRSY